MKHKLERYWKKAFIGVTVLVTSFAASAFEGERENYVELGDMKTESTFRVITPAQISENFVIPIYKKQDYKGQALGPENAAKEYKDISINNPAKPKLSKQQESKLVTALRRLTVYPVPKYSFGKEQVLKRNNFGWSSSNYQEIRSVKLKKQNVQSVLRGMKEAVNINLKQADLKEIKLNKLNETVVVQNDVDTIKIKTDDNFKFKELALFLRKPKDHDLLAADILFTEKNSCEEVVPISQYLTDKKTKDNRVKFYRGHCLHEAKMFSESIPLLSEVIGTSSEYYAKKAVDKILEGLPKGYESVIAKGLAPKNVYKKLSQKQKDKYNYILAKGHFVNEKYKRSEAHAKLVSAESPDSLDARFIIATSQYMSGRLRAGIATISSLQSDIDKKDSVNTDFKSLVSVTLGRFLFERGAYKESIANYEKVSREHPLWVDSLIEKGWAQIKLGDYSGAIGNMFTLHSPFFKDAFIPESYVIRTIGYLNLCQFGDADNTLSYLETEYPGQKRDIASFIEGNNSYYTTLTDFLGTNTEKIYKFKDLPTSIIREMGRDRDYLVIQTKLNNIVDEIPMFKKFASTVLDKRGELKAEIAKLTEESKELRIREGKALKDNEIETAKAIKKKRRSIFNEGFALNFRIKLFDKGIIEYKKANGNAVKRAELMRDEFKNNAEAKLSDSLAEVDTRLETVLRNNDLLRYEVFANSGKNIRFRVAGGGTQETEDKRAPAEARSKKDYGWKFKGEFWQDEIGNFKSDLVNLCPKK
jgi:hypothetical protein